MYKRLDQVLLGLYASLMELFELTATELVRLVRSREVSAAEVLQSHLDRIDAVNGRVNAIVTHAPELAADLAAAVDRKIAAGEEPGLLAGLPIAHKDLVQTQGIRTTFGSRLFADFVPNDNALLVDRLQAAGALTLGKTNVPEWGAGSQTFNEVFGPTRNPYHTTKTCGGSSGGAAVALAEQMVPIADGSDMGGSLRNPASFCHVVGFRVSPGRVPSLPAENGWSTLPVLGPMARTVEDCALLLDAMAGPDPACPISLPLPAEPFHQGLDMDMKGTRIALAPDFGGQLPVAQEVQDMTAASAAVFEAMGCQVDAACPDFAGSDEVFKTLRAASFSDRLLQQICKQPDMFKQTVIWNAEEGAKLTAKDIARAEQERTRLFVQVSQFMQEYDFLVLPVSQVLPFDVATEYPTAIEGVAMATYIDWMKSCYYISNLGLPAISVPFGFTDAGLPVGIQIVGRHLADKAVLQIAFSFEQALG